MVAKIVPLMNFFRTSSFHIMSRTLGPAPCPRHTMRNTAITQHYDDTTKIQRGDDDA